MHPATIDPQRLLKDCQVRRQRRSGPGGQHRNKVETAIVIEHLPSGIRGEAAERRSQQDNHRVALHRLRLRLALELRGEIPAGGDGHQPSPLWHRRIVAGGVDVSVRHEDFPALLAEALDLLSAGGFDIKRAAQCLGITSSQLVKLLKVEPKALALVNDDRKRLGLRALR